MRIDKKRFLPPGSNYTKTFHEIEYAILFAVIISFKFFVSYASAWNEFRQFLKNNAPAEAANLSGGYFADFGFLFSGSFVVFWIVLIALLLLIFYNYSYFYREKSIYVMKRLPDRMELHRRCLTVPLCSILFCLGLMAALFLLYYAFYMLITPNDWIESGQWERIFSDYFPTRIYGMKIWNGGSFLC